MARVGRLAGALLAESDGAYFLVGDTKRPCDWAAEGFDPPGECDPVATPYVRLVARRPVDVTKPYIVVGLEGEALARLLARRMLIERNGSVSDRLWRLVIGQEDPLSPPPADVVEAHWLATLPDSIWRIVRDTVLRCL